MYHILREASASLLVQRIRAIPEPRNVERATVLTSRFRIETNQKQSQREGPAAQFVLMKHKLLKLIPVWMLAGLLPSALNATDFTYTYEGQTITYTILDEAAKTVKTKESWRSSGNDVAGSLILPETVYYENEPYTLTEIGEYGFFRCSSLTEVTLPNSVTAIGYAAFNGCNDLTSLTLPNSLTTIRDWAFENCSSLANIILPNSVTSIGESAFSGCSGLTQDVYNAKIFAYASRQPNRMSCEIPDGIEIILGSAFRDFSGLTSVTLPNSLTTIGESAFRDCSGLTDIMLPNSVNTIEGSAFYGCSSLTRLTLPDNSATTVHGGAFYRCSSLILHDLNEVTSATISGEVRKADDRSDFEPIAWLNGETASGKYLFGNLSPETKYNVQYGFIYNGTFCYIDYESVTTAAGDEGGIEEMEAKAAATAVVGYWNVQGVRSDRPYRGLNLVRYSDGTVRKEIRE